MGNCFLAKKGDCIDFDTLTAQNGDVGVGTRFIGKGGEDPQMGSLPDNPPIQYSLSINETYNIPPGIHSSGGGVTQSVDIVKTDISVVPEQWDVRVGIKGKYMEGDVLVGGVENLLPENIKKGVFIGSIEGTWEGFINGDPLQPYWYGIFPPGQTGKLIKNMDTPQSGYTYVSWSVPDDMTGGKAIEFGSRKRINFAIDYPGITFATPIVMQGVKSVTMEYMLPSHSASKCTWLVLAENDYPQIYDLLKSAIMPELGVHEVFVLPATADNMYETHTFTLASAEKYHYIYAGIGVPQSSTQGRFMLIRSIKLNL